MSLNRFHREPVEIDANHEATYSDMAVDGVSIEIVRDDDGNEGLIIHNLSGTTIDPNADTTYDAAPTGKSEFRDYAGGKIYYKSSDTAWTQWGS